MQPFGGLGCGSSEAAVRKHESIVRATPSPPTTSNSCCPPDSACCKVQPVGATEGSSCWCATPWWPRRRVDRGCCGQARSAKVKATRQPINGVIFPPSCRPITGRLGWKSGPRSPLPTCSRFSPLNPPLHQWPVVAAIFPVAGVGGLRAPTRVGAHRLQRRCLCMLV
jgi:hypothetical protein